eukprot:3136774-Pleurochrysis_carterae.AAC.1
MSNRSKLLFIQSKPNQRINLRSDHAYNLTDSESVCSFTVKDVYVPVRYTTIHSLNNTFKIVSNNHTTITVKLPYSNIADIASLASLIKDELLNHFNGSTCTVKSNKLTIFLGDSYLQGGEIDATSYIDCSGSYAHIILGCENRANSFITDDANLTFSAQHEVQLSFTPPVYLTLSIGSHNSSTHTSTLDVQPSSIISTLLVNTERSVIERASLDRDGGFVQLKTKHIDELQINITSLVDGIRPSFVSENDVMNVTLQFETYENLHRLPNHMYMTSKSKPSTNNPVSIP